jgi:hypothetical protein
MCRVRVWDNWSRERALNKLFKMPMLLGMKAIIAMILLTSTAATIAAAGPGQPGVSLDALARAAATTPIQASSPTIGKTDSSKSDSLIETKKKAEAGDAKAQFALAEQFAVMQKFTAAEQWYRAAGVQGEPAAIFALAEMYQFTRGVAPNMVKANPTNAITLTKLAAALGYSKAHLALGLAYKDGANVRKDLIRAYSHLKLSEANARRDQLLNQVVADMSQEQIDAAERIVADFKPLKFDDAFGDLVFESIRVTGIFGGADRRIAMLNGKQLGAGQQVNLLVGGLEAQVKLDEIANDGVFVTYRSMERKIKPQRL